jgi:hypothetical protein
MVGWEMEERSIQALLMGQLLMLLWQAAVVTDAWKQQHHDVRSSL